MGFCPFLSEKTLKEAKKRHFGLFERKDSQRGQKGAKRGILASLSAKTLKEAKRGQKGVKIY